MSANFAVSYEDLHLALTDNTPAGAKVLLNIALKVARQFDRGKEGDLTKTPIRKVYSAIRQLKNANETNIHDRMRLVVARVAYLNEVVQRSNQMRFNREVISYLLDLTRKAQSIILEVREKAQERANRFVELFQAILAYQAQLSKSQTRVIPPLSTDKQNMVELTIQGGNSKAMFDLAQAAIQELDERSKQRLEITKTQLRNIFGTLKVLQTANLESEPGKTALWQLRLLEPRLLYALSRDSDLSSIVKLLYHALQKLFETNEPPAEYVSNFIRLAETLVALQVYEEKKRNPNSKVTDPANKNTALHNAIRNDDGKELNKQAQQIGKVLKDEASSRGQLFNLYTVVRRLEVGVETKGWTNASLQELQRLRSTLRYSVAREEKLQNLFGSLDEALVIVFETNDENEQKCRADWFTDFFEAILAWQTVFNKGIDKPVTLPMTKIQLKTILDGNQSAMSEIAQTISVELHPENDQANKLSKGQLRSVFAMLKQESVAARFATSEEVPQFKRRLWLLIPRFEYAAARENGLEALKEVAKQGLETILQTNELTQQGLAKQLANLTDLLEGILAFHVIS